MKIFYLPLISGIWRAGFWSLLYTVIHWLVLSHNFVSEYFDPSASLDSTAHCFSGETQDLFDFFQAVNFWRSNDTTHEILLEHI